MTGLSKAPNKHPCLFVEYFMRFWTLLQYKNIPAQKRGGLVGLFVAVLFFHFWFFVAVCALGAGTVFTFAWFVF